MRDMANVLKALVKSNRKRAMMNETNNASKVKKLSELSVEEIHGLNNSKETGGVSFTNCTFIVKKNFKC